MFIPDPSIPACRRRHRALKHHENDPTLRYKFAKSRRMRTWEETEKRNHRHKGIGRMRGVEPRAARYCIISFNSARVGTRDPKYRFGTAATNEFWHDTFKNSAFKTKNYDKFAFFAPRREIWPVSRVLHSALGAVTRDRDQTSSRHRGCVTRDRRIE
jgi:hypothetical protein